MFDQFMMHHAGLLLVAIVMVLAEKQDDTRPASSKIAISGPILERWLEQLVYEENFGPEKDTSSTKGMLQGRSTWYLVLTMFYIYLHNY